MTGHVTEHSTEREIEIGIVGHLIALGVDPRHLRNAVAGVHWLCLVVKSRYLNGQGVTPILQTDAEQNRSTLLFERPRSRQKKSLEMQ